MCEDLCNFHQCPSEVVHYVDCLLIQNCINIHGGGGSGIWLAMGICLGSFLTSVVSLFLGDYLTKLKNKV